MDEQTLSNIAWIKNAIATAGSIERLECIAHDIGADVHGGADYTLDLIVLNEIRELWKKRRSELGR